MEIGPAIAASVYDFCHSEIGAKILAALKSVGVDPQMAPPAAAASSGVLPFANQTIVVTGTLAKFKRDEIEQLIQKLGGRASGSVSKKTSFLVAGTDAGSKLAKAKELNVPVLTEDEFIVKAGVSAKAE
jgi:DNA ligase (NAD+)